LAHTPEQRDRIPLCGAKKKNGDSCRAFAGQGTAHPGVGRCRFHLGNTKSHQQNAVVQEAQRRMIKLGIPVEVEPHEALLSMLYLASGHVAWLREEIGSTDDLGTFEAKVLVQLYGEERDRVTKIAKAALDAGVAERQIAFVERYADALADLLRSIFFDGELDLTEPQRARLPDVLRRHLVTLEGPRALAA
jgi:hypothetical protein